VRPQKKAGIKEEKTMLSEQELARLANTFQVPLIVQDILDAQETLSPDVQYALHEIISDYQPDSALLCIAMSAHKIAARFQYNSPNMAILKMECNRIISDYAALWLSHAENKGIDNNIVFDTLEQIPEDLEAMAELIEINMSLLRSVDEELAGLAEILAVQAKAQVLIADTFIDIIEQNDESPQAALTLKPLAYADNDNIIQFPGAARA
jgi:hypothetical protein